MKNTIKNIATSIAMKKVQKPSYESVSNQAKKEIFEQLQKGIDHGHNLHKTKKSLPGAYMEFIKVQSFTADRMLLNSVASVTVWFKCFFSKSELANLNNDIASRIK